MGGASSFQLGGSKEDEKKSLHAVQYQSQQKEIENQEGKK